MLVLEWEFFGFLLTHKKKKVSSDNGSWEQRSAPALENLVELRPALVKTVKGSFLPRPEKIGQAMTYGVTIL